MPSSATFCSISPPWGTWGDILGHRGQDRAGGTPCSPPSPNAGYSVTSDWGTAETELLGRGRGRRAEPLCLGSAHGRSGPACLWAGVVPPAVHRRCLWLPPDSPLCPHTEGRNGGTQPGCTAWVPDVCARCVCPHMHIHTPEPHTGLHVHPTGADVHTYTHSLSHPPSLAPTAMPAQTVLPVQRHTCTVTPEHMATCASCRVITHPHGHHMCHVPHHICIDCHTGAPLACIRGHTCTHGAHTAPLRASPAQLPRGSLQAG